MKKEKINQMKNRAQGKKISETVRNINIVSLIVVCIGFLLSVFSKTETLAKIGDTLIIVGALTVFLTLAFQIMMAVKMRKDMKK